MTTKDFVIDLPSGSTPGFLRRQKVAIRLMARLKALTDNPDETIVDDITEFILPFVTEPTDREEAADMILDMSQDDFTQILSAVTGGDATPEEDIPPANGRK